MYVQLLYWDRIEKIIIPGYIVTLPVTDFFENIPGYLGILIYSEKSKLKNQKLKYGYLLIDLGVILTVSSAAAYHRGVFSRVLIGDCRKPKVRRGWLRSRLVDICYMVNWKRLFCVEKIVNYFKEWVLHTYLCPRSTHFHTVICECWYPAGAYHQLKNITTAAWPAQFQATFEKTSTDQADHFFPRKIPRFRMILVNYFVARGLFRV